MVSTRDKIQRLLQYSTPNGTDRVMLERLAKMTEHKDPTEVMSPHDFFVVADLYNSYMLEEKRKRP